MRSRPFVLRCGASSAALLAFLGWQAVALARALPGGGHFAEGRGSLSRDGGRLTVEQDSRTAIIDWKSFSVGKANGVVFDNGHGATLNIVRGGNISRVAGDLQSTGSVYLINRAGVVIGKSGRVDTEGSFLASGRAADTDAFGGGGRRLRLTGSATGAVINRGAIASGASVTLYGRAARAGSIAAQSHVETSGEHVRLHGASVSARNWLIDPRNLSVGGQAAHAIEASLDGGTDVTLKTTATSASGPGKKSWGDGDITIAARIDWTSDATLKLDSYHSIFIKKPVTLSGPGRLILTTSDGGSGGDYLFSSTGRVAFTDVVAGDTEGTLNINGDDYTLANSIAQLASDISGDAAGNYALAGNYDASVDGTYAHAPIAMFDGTFEGLGNTISNLSISSTSTNDLIGLFGQVGPSDGNGGMIRDIGLINADITVEKTAFTGVLAGWSSGAVLNSYASGTIVDNRPDYDFGGVIGGLIGSGTGSLLNDHANVNIQSSTSDWIGGLAGELRGSIALSYATGSITDGSSTDDEGDTHSAIAGGLVGFEWKGASIRYSRALGDVTVGSGNSGAEVLAGGLVGFEDRTAKILHSHATGNLSAGNVAQIGGLVGKGSSISYSYATGNVTV